MSESLSNYATLQALDTIADASQFLPDLIRDKRNGGARTAQRLGAEIFKYILGNPQVRLPSKFLHGWPSAISDNLRFPNTPEWSCASSATADLPASTTTASART